MKLNPYFAVILAATIGGSSGIFIKLLNLPATTMTFFRVVVPVVVLLGFFAWKKIKLFQGNFKIMLFASLLNAIRMFLYVFAYLYTSIGNAVIILFTWPIFATIFGIIILKEKVKTKTALLIGLAFLGIIIMYINKEISFGNKDFLGMAAMLLSAILFALTMVIFKKELKDYSKTETVFYQNIVGALIFLPFIFINKPVPNIPQIGTGIIYGLLVGIAAYALFFFALKKLKMSHYSLFTYWEVPAALIFSVIFFKEIITLNVIIGGLLIIIAGFLLRKKTIVLSKKK
ncbi:MAG: DMT family transporter [Nanoarchaeota archaeon]|nr:DMT family transporter [Nanoarchaeota archaeon]MBU1322150.1 DMT family transporter [Nanoarchaeota archaeon]MBU1597871.1 DMT family transporter [Nanoarchaeota archaeon]MBU2441290.1 DMT family transporter [Nanoarchaeota archaeon]